MSGLGWAGTGKALAQKKFRIRANSNSILNEFISIEFLNDFHSNQLAMQAIWMHQGKKI